MTPQEALNKIKQIEEARKRVWKEDLPEIIATAAVNFFHESFQNEGSTDKSLKKWADVKRRDPNSEWYGFSPTNKNRFSPTRAQDKILIGDGHLKDSITYKIKPDRVTISSDLPYAAVHNFGGQAKVFGKKAFTMKARPFIYHSEVLNKRIWDKFEKVVTEEIKKIKNS